MRVAGVSGVTTTNGSLFVAGCGFVVGVAVVGVVVLLVGVDCGGGVTVIAGVTMPSVRLVAHNMAITPGLMLLSFMVSAVPYVLSDYC